MLNIKILVVSIITLIFVVFALAQEPKSPIDVKPNVLRDIIDDYTFDLTNGNEIVSEHIAGVKYKYAKNDDIIIYTKKRSDGYCPANFTSGFRTCEIPFEIISKAKSSLNDYSISFEGLEKYDIDLFYSTDYNTVVDIMENFTWDCIMFNNTRKIYNRKLWDCTQLTEQYIKVSRKEFYNYKPIKDLKQMDLTNPVSVLIKFDAPVNDVFHYDIIVEGKADLSPTNSKIALDPSTGVGTCQDLEDMDDDVTADYHLTGNIDCSGHGTFTPVVDGGNPYTGTFDGKNFTVNDLSLSEDGLFEICGAGCVIQYVGIVDVSITNPPSVSGALAGSTNAGGTILKCYSTGAFSGGGYDRAGGLVGYMYNASDTITDSYSNVTIGGTCFENCGGLVATIVEGSIETSYANNIRGTCYDKCGGAVGLDATPPSCHLVYYDSTVSGLSDTTCGASPETTANMKKEATFTGFDFANVWNITEDVNYPVFIWQIAEAPPVDTCTCAGLNNNWEIDMSDECTISDNCDLGTGTLSFTGSGFATCNAIIDTTNLGDPTSGGILYIDSSCLINVD